MRSCHYKSLYFMMSRVMKESLRTMEFGKRAQERADEGIAFVNQFLSTIDDHYYRAKIAVLDALTCRSLDVGAFNRSVRSAIGFKVVFKHICGDKERELTVDDVEGIMHYMDASVLSGSVPLPVDVTDGIATLVVQLSLKGEVQVGACTAASDFLSRYIHQDNHEGINR